MTRPHHGGFGGRAGTTVQHPAPLPQGNPGSKADPVRIVNGFTATLPGRSRLFFQRQFFADCPRPVQVSGPPGFPRNVPIIQFQLPKQQALVIRRVEFNAFESGGIGTNDIAEVPFGRSVGTLAFQFSVGNRGLTDSATNLPLQGIPVSYGAGQPLGAPVAPISPSANVKQGVGISTPNARQDMYAGYGMPGDLVTATALLLRPPDFDLRFFSVSLEGWLATETELQRIIDMLSR